MRLHPWPPSAARRPLSFVLFVAFVAFVAARAARLRGYPAGLRAIASPWFVTVNDALERTSMSNRHTRREFFALTGAGIAGSAGAARLGAQGQRGPGTPALPRAVA